MKVRNLDAFVISCGWSVNVCQYETFFFLSPTAESQTQSSSMVVMGAIAGGGVMLLIVAVILLLHKRLEKLSLLSHFTIHFFPDLKAGFPNFALVASPYLCLPTLFTFQL